MRGDFRHGSQVRFGCLSQYQRIGAASSTCNDGTWSNSAPICKGNDIFSLAMHCHPSAVTRFKALKLYTFLDRQVYAVGQEFHQEDLYIYMETAFSMETKFSFHALETTIYLEVKEVDVLGRDGIQAYQNAKVGFLSYSLHFRPGLSFAVVLMKRKRLKGEEKQKILCVTWIV